MSYPFEVAVLAAGAVATVAVVRSKGFPPDVACRKERQAAERFPARLAQHLPTGPQPVDVLLAPLPMVVLLRPTSLIQIMNLATVEDWLPWLLWLLPLLLRMLLQWGSEV